MSTEQDTETIKKGHALSLLKAWLLKFKLNPNLLAVLSPECLLQPFTDKFHTHELNTFVLQSAAFYQDFDGDSKDVYEEYFGDFYDWKEKHYIETSNVFLEVLKNTLRYRGVYTGNGDSICNQLNRLSCRNRRLAWDEEDLQRSFKQLSPAFQEEVISKELLPKDVLSTLVTKQQSSTENEVKSIVKEDHSKEVEREEDHSNKVESKEDLSKEVESEAKDKSLQSSDANVTVLDKATKTHRTEADCLVQFAEVWRNEDDYTGDLFDNLDYKIKEFKWIMNILQIESNYWPYCFQYILRKQAKHFARDNFKGELSFDQMIEALKDQFETAEIKQYHRFIWTNVTFKSIESENPTKSKSEVLQALITKIRACQFALGDQYAANVHIVDCLLRACRDEPYLALAYDNIPKNFEAACAVLHKALEGRTRFNSTTSVFTDQSSTID